MPEQPIGFAQVLAEETREICDPADQALLTPAAIAARQHEVEAHFGGLDPSQPLAADFEAAVEEKELDAVYRVLADIDRKRPRTALCLSGGGIRSATFALGVLQGLARDQGGRAGEWPRGLDVDYLSTVSGGGYIGSWLSAWIHREAQTVRSLPPGQALPPAAVAAQAFERVVGTLRRFHGTSRAAESPPVEYLRDYSNYLNPWLGLLSADTWTLIATYARNLLLNWLVLLPLLALLPLLPQVCAAAPVPGATVQLAALLLGGALVAVAISYITRDLPGSGTSGSSQGVFLRWFLAPLVVGGTLLCGYWFWTLPAAPDLWLGARLVGFGVAVHLAGASWGRFRTRRDTSRAPQTGGLLGSLVAVALAGGVAGLLAWGVTLLALDLRAALADDEVWTRAYIVLALPAALLLYITATTTFVGFTSRMRTEQDREWWARECGWLMIIAVGWLVFAGVSLFSAELWSFPGLPWLGGGSGMAAWILGRSAVTPAPTGSGRSMSESIAALVARLGIERVAQIAAAIFILALLAGLAAFDAWLAPQVAPALAWTGDWQDAAAIVAVGAGLLLLGALAGWVINVNRFSLHTMYRNRLIRAYLGASRSATRCPHLFTGFDPHDDVPMAAIDKQRPLHVVNLALNLVKGQRLAWQHRKAESFVVTPRYCGSATSSGKGHRALGFRPSARYAIDADSRQGISLGTALAISGAAASPNMGYNSSPLVAFVMTLFNARLGWWLGNPGRGEQIWTSDGPLHNSAWPIFSEAFGMTTDTSSYVYLSDGGHFENLGLYEMVLRRCRRIIVVDATCDPEFDFADLGNAVRKIRIDLGIDIDFDSQFDVPVEERRGQCVYVGRIGYQRRDGCGDDGTLLYLKPTRRDTAPADVLEYSRTHPRFPHESTVDQWFNEPQFESYRQLGRHTVDVALAEYRARLASQAAQVARDNGSGPHPPGSGDAAADIAAMAPPE